MENSPLARPPPGITPNFTHPESRTYQLYITVGVCMPVVVTFAAMRLYAKMFVLRTRSWDDYLYPFSFFAGIVYMILVVENLRQGAFGHHAWDLTLESLTAQTLRLALANSFIYGPVIWLTKLLVFLLYLEVFGHLRWLRTLVYIGSIITGLFYLSSSIAFLTLCAPRDGNSQLSYLKAQGSPRCAHNQTLNIVTGAFYIASDFYLLILPLPAIWPLQLPIRKKIGVSMIILTGLAACISSILTLYFRATINAFGGLNDLTWTVVSLYVVSIIELSAGLMIPCMPSVTVVYQRLQPPTSSFVRRYGRKFQSLAVSSSRTDMVDMDSNTEILSSKAAHHDSYAMISEPRAALIQV